MPIMQSLHTAVMQYINILQLFSCKKVFGREVSLPQHSGEVYSLAITHTV